MLHSGSILVVHRGYSPCMPIVVSIEHEKWLPARLINQEFTLWIVLPRYDCCISMHYMDHVNIYNNLPSSSVMEMGAKAVCNETCPLGLLCRLKETVNISSNSIKSSSMIVILKHCGDNRLAESNVRVMTAGEKVQA